MVCKRSSFGSSFFRMDGRYVHSQSNLRTSLPCTTSLVVAGSKPYRTISAVRFVKSFRSDAGGLASLGRRRLSVRHRRTRFARPPIGVRRDRLSDGRTLRTLTIKGVLQRPAVKDISLKSPCEVFFSYIHAYIHTSTDVF